MNNPISKTAYYTLACRFWDTQKPKPVCNDNFASVFMNDEAREIAERFKPLVKPNASIVVRHSIISELLRNELDKNASLMIINIGCGFDTRPFRHTGGRWLEVDEPALIHYKNACLPASQSKNELTRIPIQWEFESLKEKLSPYKLDSKVVIIAEGVTMYLKEEEQHLFLNTLQALFPQHMLICDVMTLPFSLKYSQDLHQQINTLGASFKAIYNDPEAIFHKSGYLTKRRISAPLRSAELGIINIPAWLIRNFMPVLRKGLCVYEFDYGVE